MKTFFTGLVLAACSILTLNNFSKAAVVSFGSGSNQFNMEFVTIGNPGNPADTTGAPNLVGKVDYVYGLGKYEVSEDMIDKYNSSFGSMNSLIITKNARGNNKPATGVSWNEAARFVNWLNTSKGKFAAYKFTTIGVNENIDVWDANLDPFDYDVSNPYRSKRTTFAMPSYNEWYKAAYYSPSGIYFDFPNGFDTAPTAVASGTSVNTAVYNQSFQQGPSDINLAGGLSPYGVMGLGGNAFEWEESSFDLNNSSGTSSRGFRGAAWYYDTTFFASSSRLYDFPLIEGDVIGFRVTTLSQPSGGQVPEPTSMAIFGLGALGMAYRARRKAMA